MSFEQDGIKQIDTEELKELVKSPEKGKVIIDVRELDEYEAGHIPGVPLLPMNTIPSLLDGFDKNNEYVFICRSGNRSQNVSLYMKENGFDKVTNFNGGMLSWDGDTKNGPEHYIQSPEELKKWK
ncbi:rhodanese-like domain-containing protein [Evansella sp. AB-P1]|uniref:rhodanese-like domain-containing protein n=1 Tax=Evansella sp. AB-P1 TaxID=3037653 RepID=UPI00241D722C|nr:rhodanese-like domain-containing protein [Evansella sp. AB-P1]MDG5789194.1 rhodanese-like domain-containing protein [Evansella sp. AB-P1]